MTPQPNELWRVRGMFLGEPEATVRIDEVLESGNVDVEYPDGSYRILPKECLIERVEPAPEEE